MCILRLTKRKEKGHFGFFCCVFAFRRNTLTIWELNCSTTGAFENQSSTVFIAVTCYAVFSPPPPPSEYLSCRIWERIYYCLICYCLWQWLFLIVELSTIAHHYFIDKHLFFNAHNSTRLPLCISISSYFLYHPVSFMKFFSKMLITLGYLIFILSISIFYLSFII